MVAAAECRNVSVPLQTETAHKGVSHGAETGGEKGVFLILSVICFAALIAFIPVFFKLPPLNGETK